MRRSALRDRNDESGVDAIARIKAIAAGKISRSAFLDDSDVECSPSAHPLGTAENKENAERMSDSDEDCSPAQPVRRKKNRLVRKSQLETEDAEEAESPSPTPLPKARPRRAVFIDSDSDSEAEEVAKTDDEDDDEDAGDDALVDAMRGLEVKKPSVAPQAAPAPFAPRPAPFAPVAPATRPPQARAPSVPAPGPPLPRRAATPATPARAKSNPRASSASPSGAPLASSVLSHASPLNPLDPSGGPRPMRLKGREGGPRFELAGALASRLYDHQRDGVRWMWNLQLQGRGGILADDMGLGKTLQVAAFAAGLLRSRAAKRVLCLAPTTLLPHWGKEFVVAGLVEGVNLFKYAGGGSKSERDKALRAVTERGGVLLSTYGMVTHNDVALGAPESEEDAERVAAASGRGAAVSGQDMPARARGGLLWDWIVCDEGHKLKNPAAQLPMKIRTLPSSHRLVITGTPIQNDLNELWALYDLCCPGLLGDAQEFRREYAKRIAAGQSRDATERQRSAGARASDELRKLCRPFMLRREKSAVLAKAEAERVTEGGAGGSSSAAPAAPGTPSAGGASGAPRTSIEASTTGWAGVKHAPTQLGKKNDLVVWIPLRPAQKRLYRAFLDSSVVRRALNKTGSALAAINVLKKICDHPALCAAMADANDDANARANEEEDLLDDPLDADAAGPLGAEEGKGDAVRAAVASAGLTPGDLAGDTESSGKAAFLRALLTRLANGGHRVLVFSQSIKMLDVVERAAREDGHALVRVDGRVPAEERHARVERFQRDPDIPLALLTTQVGGLGLTLTAADRVVIYDPSWNPAADSQSVDRAYRIGQTRDVVVYRLVTCGTVEEKVYRRQVFKGGLSRAGTRDGNHFRYFSADDTSGLFECTDAGFAASATQRELEALHLRDRAWTKELADSEAPMVRALGAAGISDHDLLFSKEDTTKAGEGASTLKGGGAFGGGGSRAAAAAAAAGKARARGRARAAGGRASTPVGAGTRSLACWPRPPARRWPRRPPRSRSRQRPRARPRRSRSRAARTRAPRRRRPRTRPSARRRRSCARCACRRRSRRRCWTCPAC
jgi:superfamily II DNA or RNA helicase